MMTVLTDGQPASRTNQRTNVVMDKSVEKQTHELCEIEKARERERGASRQLNTFAANDGDDDDDYDVMMI